MPKSIAVIGAGLAGITIARQLSTHADVSLFEQTDCVGGRIATQQVGQYSFDYGAQFFTIKTAAFKSILAPYLLEPWQAMFAEIDQTTIALQRQWQCAYPHWVGVATMSTFIHKMATGLSIHFNKPIQQLRQSGRLWTLIDQQQNSCGSFDQVILAVPAAIAVKLLPNHFYARQHIQSINMLSCYALMLGLHQTIKLPWQVALVRNSPLSWISLNHTKPQRQPACSIVALAANRWADQQAHLQREEIKTIMLTTLCSIIGDIETKIDHIDLHHWPYANIGKQNGPKAFWDKALQLGVCGDWCIQGRVEAAFLSAMYLAECCKKYS